MRPPRGSWANWLEQFDIGERRWLETPLEGYAQVMRIANMPLHRRSETLRERRYTASLFTAVAAGKAGEIRYLICIERLA